MRKLNTYATKFIVFCTGIGTSTESSWAFIMETNILRIRFLKALLGSWRRISCKEFYRLAPNRAKDPRCCDVVILGKVSSHRLGRIGQGEWSVQRLVLIRFVTSSNVPGVEVLGWNHLATKFLRPLSLCFKWFGMLTKQKVRIMTYVIHRRIISKNVIAKSDRHIKVNSTSFCLFSCLSFLPSQNLELFFYNCNC